MAYGFPASGTFKQILDEMCYANDLEWDIGNGQLTVKDKRGRTPDATAETAVILNKDSGLIGIPQLDRKSTRLNSSHSAKSRMPSSA